MHVHLADSVLLVMELLAALNCTGIVIDRAGGCLNLRFVANRGYATSVAHFDSLESIERHLLRISVQVLLSLLLPVDEAL